MAIEQLLKKKTAKERANFKSKEIAKLPPQARQNVKFSGADYDIEIVNIEAIEGGVQVFARAWNPDGTQIGFGPDGTVDIERFRIFNPPILVSSPTGRILREWKDIDGLVKQRKFEENPRQALLETIAHNVKLVGKPGTNIIPGKVGNTTSTFFADTADGNIRKDNETTWSAARDAATGDQVSNASADFLLADKEAANNYNVSSFFLMFDTGATIGSDAISSATLSVYENNSSSDTDAIGVVQGHQATWNSLVTGDFDARGDAVNSPTEGATRVSSFSANSYLDFPLNATGISWIAKSGETKPASASASGKTQLAIRFAKDIDDSEPTARNFRNFSMADQTGTTQDPKLVVEHAAAAGGGTPTPTLLTLGVG